MKFLICSNVEQESQFLKKFDYVRGSNHLIEDMYSLSQCDYIIAPPSTFTMWASFYEDKPLYMIIDINKQIELSDFVCFDEWRGIFYSHDDWSKNYWEWTH